MCKSHGGRVALLVAATGLCFAAGFGAAIQKDNPIYRFARSIVFRLHGPDPTTSHWRQRVSIFRALPRADIEMIGDSITSHGEWSELFPGYSIGNRGISGDTTQGVVARLETVMARQVILMIGINDLIAGRSTGDVVADYSKILHGLSDHIVVAQSILLTRSDSGLNAKVAAVNAAIRAACAKLTYCSYLDLNQALAPTGALHPSYTLDGLHLTGAGYEVWRDLLAPMLAGQPSKNTD